MKAGNLLLKSILHHLLRALERAAAVAEPGRRAAWNKAADTLKVASRDGRITVTCGAREEVRLEFDSSRFALYKRSGPGPDAGPANAEAADALAAELGAALGLPAAHPDAGRLRSEEAFHDDWAASTRTEDVLVRESFEAVTAPEHRYILEKLGDIKGKRLLDLGSGLGEASVYFALRGARVTACDLSSGMLQVVDRVARAHGVLVSLHQSPAERTGLADESFDIVYAGNLLHHVDIAPTLDEARRVLAPGGVFVSWDPLAHNPAINVYRAMAGAMRTPDEHPLRMEEIGMFRERFADVSYRCFWFFSLAVFLRFYLEGAHPAKERYWKKILKEASRIGVFYRRLESLDRLVLRAAPFLGRWCWNIVISGVKPV